MTSAPAGSADFSLNGHCALVTGASRGIGRALAVGLARAGADLVVAARDEAALATLCQEVAACGRRCHAVAMDVRELASIDTAFADMATAGCLPTLLVNNAGIEQVSPSTEVDEALWERIEGTNLKGAFFVAQRFAASLIERGGGGAIVNVCSLTSGIGIPTAVPYTATKSGLLGVTRALSAEWAAQGIRVNAIGPGYFRTALTEDFYASDDWQRTMLAKIPAGRFGQLDDLVGPTVFLCSDAARYVTGQLLYIDGGYMASV